MPNTIDDISGLPDHDILVRMYQKLVDHLQECAEEKNETRRRFERQEARSDDHEERICKLEENEIVETTKDGMIASIMKNPIVLFIICNAITWLGWFGYKLICHIFGMRI